MSEPYVDFARQIRTELAEKAPAGFHFNDHVVRQDAALDRLADQLKVHGEREELEGALSHALLEERDGWTLLKLLELADRLRLAGTAAALMELVNRPSDGDDA